MKGILRGDHEISLFILVPIQVTFSRKIKVCVIEGPDRPRAQAALVDRDCW